jgi:predicted CopG family antitoxin
MALPNKRAFGDKNFSRLKTLHEVNVCCIYRHMTTVTISVTTEAHKRLKNLKGAGENFSEVILCKIPVKAKNAGELLDILMAQLTPVADRKALAGIRRGDGDGDSPINAGLQAAICWFAVYPGPTDWAKLKRAFGALWSLAIRLRKKAPKAGMRWV